jgi:hypothetical protein
MPRNTNDDCTCYRNPCICNPDDEDFEDAEEAQEPRFQLRAGVVQQDLFGASTYDAKPKKKKPAPADARQFDMFGAPIERKNPRVSSVHDQLDAIVSARTDRSALLAAHWARLSALSPAQRRAAVVSLSRDESLALAEWDSTGEYHDPHSPLTLTQAHRQLLRQLDAAIVDDDGRRWRRRQKNADLFDPVLKNPDVVSIAERIRARLEAERARRRAQTEDVLDSLGQTMMEDPGFQQEVRRQEATRTMQRHAAGAQLFKERDRVVYARADGDIPASWRGQIVSHEWHPEWADDGDGHFYNVRWVTPERAKHEGVFHQSDLRSAR